MRPEHWLYTIPLRLRSLFRWAQADQELDDELRDHLDRKTEEYVAQGMTQEEARRRARLELGGIEQTKEKCRDARRVNWIQDLVQDLRHTLRQLRMAPAFTTTTVLTLALGIGATTSIFTLVHAVLLKSLPVANPQELYRLGKEARCCYWGGFSQPADDVCVEASLDRHFARRLTLAIADFTSAFLIPSLLASARARLNSFWNSSSLGGVMTFSMTASP